MDERYAKTLKKQEAKRKEIEERKRKHQEQYELTLQKRKEKEERGEKETKNIQYHKKTWLAILLSFFIVGAGQMYNGQVLKGTMFFTIYYMVIFNLMFIVLQQLWLTLIIILLMWIYNIYDAYKNAKNINTNNGNYFYNENLKISD